MEEQLLQCFEGSPALRTPFSSVLAEGCSASITTRSLEILSWSLHGPPMDTGGRMHR